MALQSATAKICSPETDILQPPKMKSAFFRLFGIFVQKLLNLFFSIQKNALRPKIVELWTILIIIELSF